MLYPNLFTCVSSYLPDGEVRGGEELSPEGLDARVALGELHDVHAERQKGEVTWRGPRVFERVDFFFNHIISVKWISLIKYAHPRDYKAFNLNSPT